MRKLIYGILADMKPLYRERLISGIQIPDGNPIFCELTRLVAVFDADPPAFVDGAENITINTCHRPPPSVLIGLF